jgi:DNA-binding XRE family transcriptional regulator
MSTKVQIIERDGVAEYAVVPYGEFQEMSRLCEQMRDIQAYDAAMRDQGEAVPHELMTRLIDGESPLRVWREHRELTQAELARQVGIDKTYLSQIENGRKSGSVAVLAKLAAELRVDVDDLLEGSSA